MFSFGATLFLTPELNAWHQKLGRFALYTAKKKMPFFYFKGVLQTLTPPNQQKFCQFWQIQVTYMKPETEHYYTFGRLKEGPNYSLFKAKNCSFTEGLKF